MAATAADRNLLFGLLALQIGLIDQSELVAAFQAWTLDKARSLADHLVALGDLDPEQRALLEALVAQHQKKHGDAGESLAAIPAGRSTRESLAQLGDPELGALIAQLAPGSTLAEAEDPDRTASFAVGTATSGGQRFRVLRPHAQGGLGAVFVALDTELHREVALKQILDNHADDPADRQRFLLEAEITGGLEHPGIVPVYGLGTYGDGRPYYAMRFIRGESLKGATERFHADEASKHDPGRRSLELRKLLRRFLDVCNAIEYAHSRGVLHRDIKPANIILGKYGETLVVDWGLAKATGKADPASGERILLPTSTHGGSETLPGSALGTPAYMSPEQAEGDLEHLGPSSDVYSLGATLYCLLTGRPPYAGDAVDVIPAVQRGDFRPPRVTDPSIDKALEAVCLKAMALRPENRYRSCRALAEDIERWWADEPVLARREPHSERAQRWMRRRRTMMTAIATALVAGTLGLAAILAAQTRANAALKSANLELQSANAREQARFDLALEAIKTSYSGVSEDLLLKEKQFDGLRTKLLRGATNFYLRLEDLLEGQVDRRSRAALGQAYHDVGELEAKVGSQAQALVTLRRGLELRLALAAESSASALAILDGGKSLMAVGDVQEATGDFAGALASYTRARELLEPLAGDASGGGVYRAAVARCLHGIGRVQYHTGHAPEALASHEQARSIRRQLADAFPDVTEYQSDLAVSYHDIGAIHRAGGPDTAALASYQRALAISQKLANANPDATQFQSALAQSYNDIGYIEMETGRLTEALKSLEQARAILQRLADANPAITRFEGDLAQSHQVIGSIQDQTGHTAVALASYDRARAILQKLVDANPMLTLFQIRLAMNHTYAGLARQRNGRAAEAADELRRAVAIQERLTDVQPDGYNLYNLACYRSLLSGIAAQPGSGMTGSDARRLGAQAVEALRRAVAAGLQDLDYMRRDSDLDPLRSLSDFRLLLMDVAMPDDPFAL
jgi:serine/threonine-protein kinase